MSMLSLSVFLDGCCWLYYSVLLNDVDVGIVSQHHCHHYLSLRFVLLARTVGCHVYCWLLNCPSHSCSVVASGKKDNHVNHERGLPHPPQCVLTTSSNDPSKQRSMSSPSPRPAFFCGFRFLGIGKITTKMLRYARRTHVPSSCRLYVVNRTDRHIFAIRGHRMARCGGGHVRMMPRTSPDSTFRGHTNLRKIPLFINLRAHNA